MIRSNLLSLFFLICTLILLPTLAFAAGSGGHGSFADLAPYWVNFVIYVGVIYLLTRKPAAQGWKTRRAKIEAHVFRGKKELEEAEGLLAEAESKNGHLDRDLKEIAQEIRQSAQREAEEIIADATARAERIVEQAGETVVSEQRAFERVLRTELAERVVEQAKERIAKELNAERDKELRQAVLGNARQLVQ